MGVDMVVNCAACYSRTKTANHEVKNSAAMRESVAGLLGESYDGSVKVRHFIEVLVQDIGAAKLKKAVKKPLNGLKVACYYGCYLCARRGHRLGRPGKSLDFREHRRSDWRRSAGLAG